MSAYETNAYYQLWVLLCLKIWLKAHSHRRLGKSTTSTQSR